LRYLPCSLKTLFVSGPFIRTLSRSSVMMCTTPQAKWSSGGLCQQNPG
jgi:hypothetical protein